MQVLVTPNAGHYPFVDQPGIFLKQVGARATCRTPPPAAAVGPLPAAAVDACSAQTPLPAHPALSAAELDSMARLGICSADPFEWVGRAHQGAPASPRPPRHPATHPRHP